MLPSCWCPAGHLLCTLIVSQCVCVCVCGRLLTVLVQEELVEAQAAGLLANEAVHVLGAVVMHGDGVLQWFDARLQTEGDLGVADGVPETQTDMFTGRSLAAEG